MALYLVKNSASGGHTTVGSNAMIVQAADVAGARLAAADKYPGDSAWADATAEVLAETTLDAAGACYGYTMRFIIRGGAAQTADPIVVSATSVVATDDLDALAAVAVIALNAHAEIAGASYAAPALTISDIADGLGDATVEMEVYDAAGQGVDLGSEFYTAITDGGVAAAALAVALVADTVVQPKVLQTIAKVE